MTGALVSRLVRWLLAPLLWDARSSPPLAFLGRRLRAGLDTVPNVVAVTDATGRIAVWNRAAVRHWGLEQSAALGRNSSDVPLVLCGQALATLEHELRSALSALHASANTLMRVRDRLSEEQEEMLLETIASQVVRLQDVLEQIEDPLTDS